MSIQNIEKVDLYSLRDYSEHLKNLTDEDKYSRFGVTMSDYGIDQLILQMLYNSKEHELWVLKNSKGDVQGWGHMAYDGESWELAVSVDKNHQRKGVGGSLIKEMLEWARVHKIESVYMHCIETNKVIQHLAYKHNLKTRERGAGERTAAIELSDASYFEKNSQALKEYTKLVDEMADLRLRMIKLMFGQHT